MDYTEIQENEVEALKAIYMDDFKEAERQKVWNKTSAPQFLIHLRPSSEYKSAIDLEIKVVMASTYPKTLPEISILNSNDLHPKQLERLREITKNTLKERKGEEMIFEVTSNLQDQLDDYARMSQESTSLDEDRTRRINQESIAMQIAADRERREAELQEQQKKKDFDEMVVEELQRADQQDHEHQEVSLIPETSDVFTFDRPIGARQVNGSIIKFQQILYGVPLATTFIGDAYIAAPVLALPRNQDWQVPLMVLHVKMENMFWETPEGRQQLNALEQELNTLKDFHHPNVLPLYEFQIGRYKLPRSEVLCQQLIILCPHWSIGTLAELVDAVGSVSIRIAKSWAVQLLEGLEGLHKAGIVHKNLSLNSVIVNKDTETGENSLMLCFPSFYYLLCQMNATHPFSASTKKVSQNVQWAPPEFAAGKPTRKSDIWQFGVVLIQALCGVQIIEAYTCPERLLKAERDNWPPSLVHFLQLVFDANPKRRPTAIELLMDSFSRTGDGYQGAIEASTSGRRRYSLSTPDKMSGYSRYLNDFDEGVVLGRGGFGQVVKARNKLDGRVYAIKKVQATSKTLSQILQEVVLLSRLDHQYVVRYYTVWLEEQIEPSDGVANEAENHDESVTESAVDESVESVESVASADISVPTRISYSLSELDLFSSNASSSGGFQFGSGSDSSGSSSEQEDTTVEASTAGKLKRIPLPVQRSTLYIQMQYCENNTLRDLIKAGLYKTPAEYWRLFREIVEALAYIHRQGIIHRDLKPTNIFIDQGQNIKIGDFGLARSVAQTIPSSQLVDNDEDLTTDVGTSLYVAMETYKGSGNYNEKIDIYSLGIIYFEMIYPMTTEMERVQIIRRLRLPTIEVPTPFMARRYERERKLVKALLDHDPKKRPSAAQLLESGDIPLSSEDLTIKDAIKSIVEAKDNSGIKDVCNALFAQPLVSAHQVLYDRNISKKKQDPFTKDVVVQRAEFVHRLRALFRVHGAVEENNFRSRILPRSALYQSKTVFEVLDTTGNVLQLPYDLTLPYARRLAELPSLFAKTFTFGTVYRQDVEGHHPRVAVEVDFDILTGPETQQSTVDQNFQDAEAIKVMADAVLMAPHIEREHIALYINHCDILCEILEYCGFTPPQHFGALSLLGEPGVGPARASVRRELLAKSTISSISLDLWEKMGFYESIETPESKLFELLEIKSHKRVLPALSYLKSVAAIVRRFGVSCPIYFAPLSHYHPTFYEKGIMFQIVLERTPGKRAVTAAGGRYDSLVKHFTNELLDSSTTKAVGFNLALDKLLDLSRKLEPANATLRPRCQFLVTTFSESNIKTACIDVVRQLWTNEISADIAPTFASSEELLRYCRQENIPYAVVVKQMHSMSMSSSFKPLKVRAVASKIDFDFTIGELVNFAMAETSTERTKTHAVHELEPELERRDNSTDRQSQAQSQPERRLVHIGESSRSEGRKQRWLLEENCQESVNQYLADMAASPVVCLDLKDEIISAICQISPHNEDEWRRRIASLNPGQKAYIMNVQQRLASEAGRAPQMMLYSTKTGNTFVYNYS